MQHNIDGILTDSNPTAHVKLRVLLVPDALPWITGTIARMIAYHNSESIDATVITGTVLHELMEKCHDSLDHVDLVHFLTNYDAELLLERFVGRIPVVLTVHHIEGQRCTSLVPQCDAIATSCMQWHNDLISSGVDEQKLVMTPYGVDTNLFRPATTCEKENIRKRLGIRPDSFVVGFCAKRSSDSSGRKGIDLLTNAVEELGRERLKICLLIVGPGWSDVVERAREAGVECVYLPYVSDQASFAEIYRALDVYWVTSRIEGGPVPVLEAMSSGVCCISTPVGMAVDLIREGENGLLVPFDDSGAIVLATKRLVEDQSLRTRIADSARDTLIDGYDWMRIAPLSLLLYKRALDRFGAGLCPVVLTSTTPTTRKPDASIPPVDVPYLSAVRSDSIPFVIISEHFCFLDMLRHSSEHSAADAISCLGAYSLGYTKSYFGKFAVEHYLKWGWISFAKKDRRRAIVFGLRALRQQPWHTGVWRLLVCIFWKPLRGRT